MKKPYDNIFLFLRQKQKTTANFESITITLIKKKPKQKSVF